MLSQRPRMASARCVDYCDIVSLSRAEFETVLDCYPQYRQLADSWIKKPKSSQSPSPSSSLSSQPQSPKAIMSSSAAAATLPEPSAAPSLSDPSSSGSSSAIGESLDAPSSAASEAVAVVADDDSSLALSTQPAVAAGAVVEEVEAAAVSESVLPLSSAAPAVDEVVVAGGVSEGGNSKAEALDTFKSLDDAELSELNESIAASEPDVCLVLDRFSSPTPTSFSPLPPPPPPVVDSARQAAKDSLARVLDAVVQSSSAVSVAASAPASAATLSLPDDAAQPCVVTTIAVRPADAHVTVRLDVPGSDQAVPPVLAPHSPPLPPPLPLAIAFDTPRPLDHALPRVLELESPSFFLSTAADRAPPEAEVQLQSPPPPTQAELEEFHAARERAAAAEFLATATKEEISQQRVMVRAAAIMSRVARRLATPQQPSAAASTASSHVDADAATDDGMDARATAAAVALGGIHSPGAAAAASQDVQRAMAAVLGRGTSVLRRRSQLTAALASSPLSPAPGEDVLNAAAVSTAQSAPLDLSPAEVPASAAFSVPTRPRSPNLSS